MGTEEAIKRTINSWNGVDLTKLSESKKYNEFREYFANAKGWWDVKKKTILGSTFWCPLLYDIKDNILNQKNNKALYQIMDGIFNAKVKYENTKEIPLIPDGTIKSSKDIKYFLYKIDHSLNIDKWLKEEIEKEKKMDSKQNKSHKRSGNAKKIAQRLRLELINLINRGDHEKDDKKNNDTDDMNMVPLQAVLINNNINNNMFSLQNVIINNNNNNMFPIQDVILNNNNNNVNTNNGGYNGYNGYNGYRGSQQYNAS